MSDVHKKKPWKLATTAKLQLECVTVQIVFPVYLIFIEALNVIATGGE